MLLKLIVTANYADFWCNANELQINPERSTIIIFPPKLNLRRPEVNFIYNTSSISLCDLFLLSHILKLSLELNLLYVALVNFVSLTAAAAS